MAEERNTVEISREFDVPRESVFRMWTDPRMVAKWWGPEGSEVVVSEVDPRPGGAMRIDTRGQDGTNYPMTGTFIRVVPPELIVFRNAGEPGAGVRSPWEAMNTVTFEELEPNRTRVRVLVQVLKTAPEDLEFMVRGFRGGWAESLERLRRAL